LNTTEQQSGDSSSETRPSRPAAPGVAARFLVDWVLPRWHQVALSLAVAVGLAIATTGYAHVMKFAFNSIGQGSMAALPQVLSGIVLVTVCRGAFLYFHQIVSNRIVLRLGVELQQRAFSHVINADYVRFTRESTGHLVSRLITETGAIMTACQMALNTLIRDAVTAIALVGYMIYLDPLLTAIVLVVYPFTALPIVLISRRLKKVARRMQVEFGEMTSRLSEKLGGARLVKTFRLEEYATAKLNQHFEQIFALRLKAVKTRARLGPILEAFAGLAIAGVIGLASWRISTGISSTGDFMAFMTCLLLAANAMRSAGNFTTGLQDGLSATERLYELLDEKPLVVNRATAKPLAITVGAIDFENISFSYEGRADKEAVKNFTLRVPGGRVAALVGRSGSGKTTVINLVPRLFDVQAGTIRIDGQDLRDVTLESLRDQIAIVSQDITLFDDTISANIALGRLNASDDDIIAAAKAAAAHDFIVAQPQGYKTMIGDSGMRLSGGQRQRLALARAILRDAPILLLDEATSALDTESERLVQDALARFAKDRTTLVIAHRLSTVQRADLICVMDDGRIVETGTHADLIVREGAYAKLCRAQVLLEAPSPSAAIN
jgi:ATP-binding cassette, subfamily B, bacterial MsbA